MAAGTAGLTAAAMGLGWVVELVSHLEGAYGLRLLKSTEFNRALGGILPLTVNSGVESGSACVVPKLNSKKFFTGFLTIAENTLEEVANLESDKLPPHAFVAQVFSAAPASDPSCKPFGHISTSDASKAKKVAKASTPSRV
ncbi:hypothetical protein Tco_0946690 [Tanacetum coccineum]